MEQLLQVAGYLVSVVSAAAIVMGIEFLNERFSDAPSPTRRPEGALSMAVRSSPVPLQRTRS